MEKLLHHFYFRFKQFFRIGNLEPNKGLGFSVFALAIICAKFQQDLYYILGFSAIILAYHFTRKDVPFLQKIFRFWHLVIIGEYLLIYSLFIFVNINFQMERLALFPIPIFLLLPMVKPATRIFTPQLNQIPDFYFEWKTYFRGHFFAVVLVYLLMIASAWHRSTLVIGALFFTGFFSYVFKYNESKEILTNFFSIYNLKQKVERNVKIYNFFLIPVGLFYLIKNPSDWQFLIYYLLYTNAYLILVITRKYKKYNHKKQETYVDFGGELEAFIFSATLIPAIFIIKNNLSDAKKNIQNYVGN